MLAPKILLADEPSAGMAPVLVSRSIDAINEMKQRYQFTLVMAEKNFTKPSASPNAAMSSSTARSPFEGRSADEINNNDLIRKYYLRS